MSDHPMMACGHAAQGTCVQPTGLKIPVCVICDCHEVVSSPPSLEGRTAKCCYCGREAASSTNLAFFEYGHWWKRERMYDRDSYYCGCRGWD